jgi:ribokinase
MAGSTSVLVIGSANLDYIVKVAAPPGPGETVLARTMIKHPGGKGANQAVAAARLGADVRFMGCVGDDDDGEQLLRALRVENVDTSAVEIVAGEPTGLAFVSVFDNGENSITVVPGANHSMQPARVRRGITHDGRASPVIVMQAEIKPEIVDAAVSAAAGSCRVVLNLAPYRVVPEQTLAACDPLVVNQSEAAAMVGFAIPDATTAQRALAVIRESVRSAVITLGGMGACWADSSGSGHVPAPPVDAVVDTTGAGDAFVGALAAEVASGSSLERATTIGVLAGTFAVTRFGAQSSYPMRSDLDRLDSLDTRIE